MNTQEFDAVLKLSGAKRYEYFIKKVVDHEELWGLYNDGWAMVADEDNRKMILFWPKKEFAEVCCVNEWSGYAPESIVLDGFIDGCLIDMSKDGLLVAIFYTKHDKGVVLEPLRLLKDLNEELENY